MSRFAVIIKKIHAVLPHDKADRLEIAQVDGYHCVVAKYQFKAGDLVAYIPEGAVLPDWIMKKLSLWSSLLGKGMLSGPQANMVRALRLRGVLSQGLCYPIEYAANAVDETYGEESPFHWMPVDEEIFGVRGFVVHEGDNVTELLKITKFEQPIPSDMAGEVFNAGWDHLLNFDVEAFQAFPNLLSDGEEVIFTEKIHGIMTQVVILPYKDAHENGFGERKNILISSKGLSAKGLAFINNAQNQAENLYVRATADLVRVIDLSQRMDEKGPKEMLTLLGETFGKGVQDLAYGQNLSFRVFAAARGSRGLERYEDWDVLSGSLKQAYAYDTVPFIYRGKFSADILARYTTGKTTLGGVHIREGVVITPARERVCLEIGRVVLKSVSPDYITRDGGTEYS